MLWYLMNILSNALFTHFFLHPSINDDNNSKPLLHYVVDSYCLVFRKLLHKFPIGVSLKHFNSSYYVR